MARIIGINRLFISIIIYNKGKEVPFIVIQLGYKGLEMANFGGNERIIATVAGIVIAFVTIFILQLIVKRDTHTEMGTAA